MPMLRPYALALTLTLASAGLAAAQADRTGTGGGPLSTERSGNVTATGQTKPPSRGASPAENTQARTRNDAEQDKLTKGICIGCAPK